MLGGGNPVGGATPGGTGTLTYVGDYAYANSGGIAAATSTTTQIEFDTGGNSLILGELILNGAVLESDQDTGSTCAFEVFLNGETILLTKVDTLQEDTPASMVFPILIPPQSNIKITAKCSNTNGFTTVNIIGRVYY